MCLKERICWRIQLKINNMNLIYHVIRILNQQDLKSNLSPDSRNRTSDRPISLVLPLQSGALPSELCLVFYYTFTLPLNGFRHEKA